MGQRATVDRDPRHGDDPATASARTGTRARVRDSGRLRGTGRRASAACRRRAGRHGGRRLVIDPVETRLELEARVALQVDRHQVEARGRHLHRQALHALSIATGEQGGFPAGFRQVVDRGDASASAWPERRGARRAVWDVIGVRRQYPWSPPSSDCGRLENRGPRRRALGPAAWDDTMDGSGRGLDAAVRVEDALPNRVLHAGVPVGGTEQREAAAFSVHGVLSSRKRHVSPSVATFPHCEADQTQSLQRTACGSEDHLRISELPLGSCRCCSEGS